MGDESNEFHREVVRPKVTELISNPAGFTFWILRVVMEIILRILYKEALRLSLFDYSKKNIELAKTAITICKTKLNFVWRMRPIEKVY